MSKQIPMYNAAERNERECENITSTLKRVTDRANDLLRQDRFEDAVSSLWNVEADFPGNEEASQLFLYALAKLAARDRSNGIENLAVMATALVEAGDVGGAIRSLNDGLNKYPGEPRLIELLRTLQKRHYDMVAQIVRHFFEFDVALRSIEHGLRSYPDEPRLLRLREEVLERILRYGRQVFQT